MKLADKIILLRKKQGYSQEELAELLEVSRQSVSKWEGAQAIPDLKKILKMSEIFDVTTDYLLKEEVIEEVASSSQRREEDREEKKYVSMELANHFLEDVSDFAGGISFGVFLCISSPIVLIFLLGLQEHNMVRISEEKASALGTLVLLGFVLVAVILIVKSVIKHAKYERFEEAMLETEYGVDEMARDRKQEYSKAYTRSIMMGVGLCIASVFPVLASVVLFGENEMATLMGTCLLLFMISIGARCITKVLIVWDGFQVLLEEGKYTKKNKRHKKTSILEVYWGMVLAGYLAYSFIANGWHISWIVWPIAGVLFPVVSNIEKRIKRTGELEKESS